MPNPVPPSRNVVEFAKQARSILWRQDKGKQTYNAWLERVEHLRSTDGGGYTKQQAIVRASKEFKCLDRLFREYDVKAYDPTPDSHPTKYLDQNVEDKIEGIQCDNIKQTYRQSLQWAMEAAGLFLRTGQHPTTCPCDAAYYLYQQAVSEPKDFMGRVGQVESKGSGENEGLNQAKKSSRRTVKELEGMLQELLESDES